MLCLTQFALVKLQVPYLFELYNLKHPQTLFKLLCHKNSIFHKPQQKVTHGSRLGGGSYPRDTWGCVRKDIRRKNLCQIKHAGPATEAIS